MLRTNTSNYVPTTREDNRLELNLILGNSKSGSVNVKYIKHIDHSKYNAITTLVSILRERLSHYTGCLVMTLQYSNISFITEK